MSIRTVLVGMFTLVTPATLVAQHVDAERPDRQAAITVVGSGTVEVAPDRAVVRLGVEREAEAADAAQGAVGTAATAILEAVRDVGVTDEDIQTSGLYLSPIYHRDPEAPRDEPTVRGYRSSLTVTIRVSDLDLIGTIVDRAVAAGANRVEGISFELRDASASRAAALAAAVEDARIKATGIARALGVELGTVLDVSEQGTGSIPPIAMTRAESFALSDGATPVNPGRLQIDATLVVRYSIGAEGGGC